MVVLILSSEVYVIALNNIFYSQTNFMKKVLLLLFALSLINTVFSQTNTIQVEDTNLITPQRWRDTCFGLLNKTGIWIPSGYLLDYSLVDSTFKGLGTNDTITESGQVFALHNIFNLSKVNNKAKLPTSTDTLLIDAYRYERNNSKIPLLFLYTNYEKIRSSALSEGLFTLTSDSVRLKDVVGRQTSPYNTKTCFVFAPLEDSIVQFNAIKFALPTEFWMMSGITSVSIDFGDGNGFRTFNKTNVATVYYNTEEGTKYLTAKITTANGDLYAKASIQYKRPAFYSQPDSVWNITVPPVYTSISDYLGSQGPMSPPSPGGSCTDGSIFDQINCDINPGAQVQVINGCDRVFDKPIIIVEGFDPTGAIDNNALQGLFDYYYSGTGTFYSTMRALGYDFVFVNFTKNTDFIENNAAVLEQVIDKVNATKTGNYNSTVIGWSMGGLVARWCLKDMEDRGIAHHVDKYFSYDAPHQGANIPLGLQYIFQEMNHDMPYLEYFKSFRQIQEANSSPAAQEMLVTKADYGSFPFYPVLSTLNPVRAKFAQALITKGYPQQATCYGISFGRGNNTSGTKNAGNGAQFGNFGPSSALFDGTLIYLIANLHATAYAVPQSATDYVCKYVYDGLKVIKIFGIPVPIGWTLRIRNIKYQGNYSYDDAPGGYENTQTQFVDGFKTGLGIASNYQHYGHNFLSMASGLDLQNQNYGSGNMYQSSNLFYNIDSYIQNPGQISGNTLSTSSLSPFKYVLTYTSDCNSGIVCQDYDNAYGIVGSNWNQDHGSAISNQATSFIMRKILNYNPSFSCPDLGFCNASFQITGNSRVCTTGTYKIVSDYPLNGINVQWSFPNGTLNITNGQGTPVVNVSKNHDGNETVTAVLTNSCGQQRTYQLPITSGSPVTVSGNPTGSCNGSYQTWYLSATPSTNGTNWNWYVSYLGVNADIYIHNPTASSTYVDVSGGGIVSLTYTDACGVPQDGGGITVYSNCHAFAITPNPAQNNITIQSVSPNSPNQLIKQVKIMDPSNNLQKSVNYNAPVSNTQIDVSDLVSGIYFVQISNDVISETQKIVIQK